MQHVGFDGSTEFSGLCNSAPIRIETGHLRSVQTFPRWTQMYL